MVTFSRVVSFWFHHICVWSGIRKKQTNRKPGDTPTDKKRMNNMTCCLLSELPGNRQRDLEQVERAGGQRTWFSACIGGAVDQEQLAQEEQQEQPAQEEQQEQLAQEEQWERAGARCLPLSPAPVSTTAAKPLLLRLPAGWGAGQVRIFHRQPDPVKLGDSS